MKTIPNTQSAPACNLTVNSTLDDRFAALIATPTSSVLRDLFYGNQLSDIAERLGYWGWASNRGFAKIVTIHRAGDWQRPSQSHLAGTPCVYRRELTSQLTYAQADAFLAIFNNDIVCAQAALNQPAVVSLIPTI